MSMIYTVAGALGLLCVSAGVVLKNRKEEDILYILGGLLLLIYSIYLRNIVFIILQCVFIVAAIFDFSTMEFKVVRKK